LSPLVVIARSRHCEERNDEAKRRSNLPSLRGAVIASAAK